MNTVLKELSPLFDEAKPNQTKQPFDEEHARRLIEELEPLLINGNTRCLDFIDALRAIPRSEELITQIGNFDFDAAVISLTELKNKMDVIS